MPYEKVNQRRIARQLADKAMASPEFSGYGDPFTIIVTLLSIFATICKPDPKPEDLQKGAAGAWNERKKAYRGPLYRRMKRHAFIEARREGRPMNDEQARRIAYDALDYARNGAGRYDAMRKAINEIDAPVVLPAEEVLGDDLESEE